MENKEIIETQEVEAIDPQVLATVEKKVAELKAKNPKKKIFP